MSDTPAPTVTPHDLSLILERQRAAFLRAGPPDLSRRRKDLRRLKAEILRRRADITRALNADFGQRSERETAVVELIPLIQAINYLIPRLRRWMKPERRRVSPHFQFGTAWVIHQPVGVVGIIAPWNYPVALSLVPLATAIAAGNRAMVKPSELTPATSAVIAEIVRAAFPPEQAAVVTGDAGLGAAFSALPFDHLLFTGSTTVGRKVAVAAAGNLTPVTLELGGKSPVVIEPGCAMGRAADRIAFGKLINGGQTCIAPDYVLVHVNDQDAFVTAYQEAVGRLYPSGFAGSPDSTALLNRHHYERVSGLVRNAEEQGARIIRLGPDRADDGSGAHVLAPVIVLDATPQMTVMQEEIFGPVLPVLTYRTMEEAIAFINARSRPLALYYFGENRALQDKVLNHTVSGNVTINGVVLHCAQDDLPFGGVGESGIGAYHGKEGFLALTHARGIYRQGRCNAATFLRPPFGPFTDIITSFLLR
ncbi:coniferyl aldehyde dehydrogenase [Acidomonas methanolica]|uniref:Aldehyde dehydrogenase n=1 Tax=Acidomonas methanolica NBRC 104435 TaxID=1231351 RepID=A0A023D161_ACIMT|nr:coniferyl aldehyde dehydrogenase [Acidomonas methanolica]MBU2655358.1 coniferyl aldehyde dehydrogenase [Acidomonas methanolica]TCS23775.1 coniferyl-aldehyde dehydrogenase [Acidomonas methanolica]GAJ27862.1 aldehyde dehydrogenase [Acidomonas methanolica NBRC 104435]GEL00246.1 aldehyde dehydrogenase [Acidomonas methanolica NBRC 104435]